MAERLAGKDLVVEHAADLDDLTVEELEELMTQDETGMVVVLIDTRGTFGADAPRISGISRAFSISAVKTRKTMQRSWHRRARKS